MKDRDGDFIDVAALRVGHYVYLDVGWMDHPFALNNFRISTEAQIATIRGLGLERVRYAPDKSDLQGEVTDADANDQGSRQSMLADGSSAEGDSVLDQAEQEREERRLQLSAQRTRLQYCESQFNDAAKAFKQIVDILESQPGPALGRCDEVVRGIMDNMGGPNDETYVRLLSEKAGERTSLHSINVTIISLLLARALSCTEQELHDIGVGAMLHDIGKMALPDRLRWCSRELSAPELVIYKAHVDKGVTMVSKLGLSAASRDIVAQHHERANGSGYPRALSGDKISPAARIVSLVNEYDNLSNPGNPVHAVTPHEALALIYAQQKNAFDSRTLSVFVRLMGVYPPGSVIELSTGHFAMVVSVNSARPLRPHVIIHDPAVPPSEAIIFDLQTAPDIGIRRSLKPLQLPKAAFDYLSPRKRLCYFFERATDTTTSQAML